MDGFEYFAARVKVIYCEQCEVRPTKNMRIYNDSKSRIIQRERERESERVCVMQRKREIHIQCLRAICH